MKRQLKLTIAGVGNCASSLVQGLEYYGQASDSRSIGIRHPRIGGYSLRDVQVVAAFDIDRRKVGKPLEEAVFAPPNCTTIFQPRIQSTGVMVRMGPLLDGVAPHMAEYPDHQTFLASDQESCDVVRVLRETDAEVLVCYLPVGSERAVREYAEACLETGVAMVNCVPVFIASDSEWAGRFRDRKIPIVGDDIKS